MKKHDRSCLITLWQRNSDSIIRKLPKCTCGKRKSSKKKHARTGHSSSAKLILLT